MNNFVKGLRKLFFVLMITGLFCVSIGYAETIEQNQSNGNIATNGNIGQSFTITKNGRILSISVYPFDNYSNETLEIYSGAGNTGALIYSQPVDWVGGSLQTINLTAHPTVSPGIYTFYVTSNNNTAKTFMIGISPNNQTDYYAGGEVYVDNSTLNNQVIDLTFRIVTDESPVNVPTLSQWAMIVLTLILAVVGILRISTLKIINK